MPTVSARPALIDDLPTIVGLLADDVLGQGRENMSPPLHSDYLDAFEAINNDPNQVFVVFEVEDVIIGCLQISFIPGLSRQGHGAARSKVFAYLLKHAVLVWARK